MGICRESVTRIWSDIILNMKIGYLGLGKMGANMVLRLREQGIEVVAWNRSDHELKDVDTVEELVPSLEAPRIIWLMLPQGAPTDEILNQLKPLLSKGDLVIDGANAFYKDTQRRAKELSEIGVRFMDIGVSGGPSGARNGACLMVGGEEEDYNKVLPLIKAAAAPNAYGYFGASGAGHYVKMIHNGIEYGMMQAIAEGAAILKSGEFNLDLAEVMRVYNNRSVIESRLVGWAEEALREDQELSNVSSIISHTGEGEWTVMEAEKNNISSPIIKSSFEVRVNSDKDDPNSLNGFRNKVVSALRGKFGGHDVKA